VNDPHAAEVSTMTLVDEVMQQSLCRLDRLAMEIQLSHDAEFTTPQSLKGSFLKPGTSKREGFAKLGAKGVAIRIALSQLSQHGPVVGMSLSGYGGRTSAL